MGLPIVLFLCLPVGAAALSGAFLYTEAPRYDVQAMLHAGDRFPAGAAVKVFANGVSRQLAPSLAMSADAALSPDAQFVLLSGKQRAGQPWQIWEVPLAGGPPRQLTSGTDDCIRPFYAAEGKFVYARKTPRGFQIEIAPLQGGDPLRLTWMAGNFLPDGLMRDGRVLFEASLSRCAFDCSRPLHGICGRFRCGNAPLRSRTGPPLGRRTGVGRPDLPNRRRAGAVHVGARRTTGRGVAERPIRRAGGGGRSGRMAGHVSRGSGSSVLDLPLCAAADRATGEGGGAECLSARAGARPPGSALPPFEPGQSGGRQSALSEFLCFEIAADSEKLRGRSEGLVAE